MNPHAPVHPRPHWTLNRRRNLAFFSLFLSLAAVLTLSGCTGLTGATTPKTNSSSGTPGLAINTQPANETVTEGHTATFSVAAAGNGTLTYQWKKNGGAIGGATAASYTTPPATSADNGAQFAVTVADSSGSMNSNPATLTVNVPPTITAQPTNDTVNVGQPATFGVTATGTGTLTYQWVKNGGAIGGANSASYTTPATVASDNGAQFAVTVTGNGGSVTSNAVTLTVNALKTPPSITKQPASAAVIAGQNATFSVMASGTGPLLYQWQKNGTAIAGANSASYTTPGTMMSDSGAQFAVTVTNTAGSALSSPATLTVNAATFVLNVSQTVLNFASVAIGNNSMLPVTFTNNGNSNVTISNVSVTGAGFTPSGISSGEILTPGQTATLNVTFAPSSAVAVTGSVTVTSNATNSPAVISLLGIGILPVSHSVVLTWTASTSTVAGYNMYRSTVSGGSYTRVNSAVVAATTFTDSAVQGGQTYYYVATAVDSSGVESVFSSEVSAAVP